MEDNPTFVCSLCLNFYSEVSPDWFVTTPKGHVFHYEYCIKPWIEKGNLVCPYRDELLTLGLLRKLMNVDPSCRSVPQETNSTSFFGRNGQANFKPDYTFKILLLGNPSVGKSSLIKTYTRREFTLNLSETIGVDVRCRTVCLDDKRIKLQMWDIGGQQRFNDVCKNFIRNMQGAVFVFSYGPKEVDSLLGVKRRLKLADEFGFSGTARLIVGNKVDLQGKKNSHTMKQAQELAISYKIPFFETSANDELSVDAMFQTLAMDILQKVEVGLMEQWYPGTSPKVDKGLAGNKVLYTCCNIVCIWTFVIFIFYALKLFKLL